MLPADGAHRPPPVGTRRRGRSASRNPPRLDRRRRPDRLGCGVARDRRPDRRRRRDSPRGLLRLPSLPGGAVMTRTGIFETPRPVPGRLLPAAGGALVLLLALPVF